MEKLNVLIAGAGSQVAYSLVYTLATGDVFGHTQQVVITLVDAEAIVSVLSDIAMELLDCSLPLLIDVKVSSELEVALKDADIVILLSTTPHSEELLGKDLIRSTAVIYKQYGLALNKYAKPDVQIVVASDPVNVNAYVCHHYAPSVDAKNFTALAILQQNRAVAQIASMMHVDSCDVRDILIWGDCRNVVYADGEHAVVKIRDEWFSVFETIQEHNWLRESFTFAVADRGTSVYELRHLSAAMSSAKAICDHLKYLWSGQYDGRWINMGVHSDGAYGFDKDIFCNLPVTVSKRLDYRIVSDLELSEYELMRLKKVNAQQREYSDFALEECQKDYDD